jgi:glutathione synthase
MTVNHLFVMDPLESLNLKLDSSLRLMYELTLMGHKTYACEPRGLSWHSERDSAHANSKLVSFGVNATQIEAGENETLLLSSFSSIHMRKDPPYDMDYITTTWLLDSVENRSRVYNHPNALRALNEKLAIFLFKGVTKPGLVTASSSEILEFIKKDAGGDGIIKPLTLFGGRGVERINLNGPDFDDESALKFIRAATENDTSARLIQAFDPAIFEGEVRAFTAFGQPIAWCLKRPAEGEYLANTRVGAVLEPYTPTPDELARVSAVAESLMREGVPFIGFDVIGEYISEINITSPRLLTPPGDDSNYYKKIAKLVNDDLGV